MAYCPSIEHISKEDKKKVYPPSVDTFLLLDSVLGDIEFLRKLNPALVLELGVGSGTVLAGVSHHLGPQAFYIGLDINFEACSLAAATMETNNSRNFDTIATDLFKGLNLEGKVDVLICNPPYVITSNEEYLECQKRKDISSSFAGGENGREFIDLMIQHKNVLADGGVIYLLFEEHNGEFNGVQLSEERRGCEGLKVVRLTKDQFI